MSVVIFTKNMMTDGGPAKAHSIGRVSTERGTDAWTVQVDHHGTQEQADRQAGIVWQTYYQMPFGVELGGCPYVAAARWLIEHEPLFSGGELLEVEVQEEAQDVGVGAEEQE